MPTGSVIPRRKDVLGYARALQRCKTRSQLDIVIASYEQHVTDAAHREVLGILADARLQLCEPVIGYPVPKTAVPSDGPGEACVAKVKAELAPQLAQLALMRGAAQKSGFRLHVKTLEIEIEG